MEDDWRKCCSLFHHTTSCPREICWKGTGQSKNEIIFIENLADDNIKIEAVPSKVIPAAVNKWDGEDEDDDIKVSIFLLVVDVLAFR